MDDVRAEAKRRYQAHKATEDTQPQSASSGFRATAPTAPPQERVAPRPAEWSPANNAQSQSSEVQCCAGVTEGQRNTFLGFGACCLLTQAIGSAGSFLLLLGGGAFLSTRMPPHESFEPFFKRWFYNEYFPKVSQKLQAELQERARSQNVLQSLGTRLQGWVMGQTETLQATAWYELSAKWALPPRFEDAACIRKATVNLGSRNMPCLVTFWGINGVWFLPPWYQVDYDNISMLDEVS